MKKTYITLLAAALLLSALPARAQLTTTITTITHDSTFAEGRDFWFAMQSNYWGENLGGKYMRIYITSDENCTAYVESLVGGSNVPIPISAYKISSYLVPAFWEVESSGVAENKAIHVYCNTADLTVYDMSHNDYTSDGSYIIPAIGWGTDYVVAAYGSLFEGSGSYVYDLPSTMMVVANQDNTVFTITPSCDLRQCTSGSVSGDANSTIVVYPQGQPQTFTINRGQCMEFIPVKATNADGFDLTGTIVHANQPIAVEGGSVCPNIPGDFPYCDHVEDMLPPVRTWGETYYATNSIQPPGQPNHDFGDYLFIASKAEQTIFRQQCDSSAKAECIIPNQYGIFWDELSGPQKFTSSAPFLVVQYINSATYPDNVNGLGDPAEAIVTPREQFTRTVMFEVPISVGNIVPYTDYANIAVNVKDEEKTLFDGKRISGFSKQCLDSNWDIFTVQNITSDTNIVTGDDSGVGVWVYGYGFDESYAWAGTAQCKTFHSTDSIPPIVTISGSCLSGNVFVQDSGVLPSKLDMLRLDTVFNMEYTVDTSWHDGTLRDSTFYNFFVVDPTKPGFLRVSAFDYAGNHTTITTMYDAMFFGSIEPPLQNLGIWVDSIGVSPKIAYDTLFNLGEDTLHIAELHLLYGDRGFSLFDSIGGPLDLSPLAPGHSRRIQIQFQALKPTPQVDSIVFGSTCDSGTVAVTGNGATRDFLVTNQTWHDEPLGNCYPKIVTIENLSTVSITIDSARWADTTHFKAITPFPVILPSNGSVPFTIDYCPDSNSAITPNRTQGAWFSLQVIELGLESPRFDSLIGWAAPLSGVDEANSATEATLIPLEDGRSLEIVLPADINGPVSFTLVNVLGESVLHTTFGAGTQNVDASSLPRGVYFYRLTSGQISQSGKIILGQ